VAVEISDVKRYPINYISVAQIDIRMSNGHSAYRKLTPCACPCFIWSRPCMHPAACRRWTAYTRSHTLVAPSLPWSPDGRPTSGLV